MEVFLRFTSAKVRFFSAPPMLLCVYFVFFRYFIANEAIDEVYGVKLDISKVLV